MLFQPQLLRAALPSVVERGYAFVDDALTESATLMLAGELRALPLEQENADGMVVYGRGTKHEVRQMHSRSYTLVAPTRYDLPHAMGWSLSTELWCVLSSELSRLCLHGDRWFLNELGYQRYEPGAGFISAHRDRRSDRILSVTATLSGEADVSILAPGPDDSYIQGVRVLDVHACRAGSLMLLRAPGLGCGKQMLHSVGTPRVAMGPREILNLRMRDDVLPQPSR